MQAASLLLTVSLPLVPLAGAGAVAAPVNAAQAPEEPILKDSDLGKLGDSLAEYLEAVNTSTGILEAENDLREDFDKLGKKLKRADVQDPLGNPADLGRALWLSNEYDKQRVKAGKLEEREFSGFYTFTEEAPLKYAAWVPSDYNARKASYPLVIVIPDQGEDPKTHLIEQWQDAASLDNLILAVPQMPESIDDWIGTDGVARVMILLRAMTEEYAVNFDRIYLAGRGSGVSTALHIANRYPDRFAGVIGRSGDAGNTEAKNFGNLPTFFAGGGSEVTAFEAQSRELGHDNCTVKGDGLEPDIWEWIQGHPRVSMPTSVDLNPGEKFPNRMAWLEVPAGSQGARVRGTVDRETNTITIQGTGVGEVTLYLNDHLVDLGRPVKVVVNGKEHQDQIPRNFKLFLDLIVGGKSDPGRIFVAAKRYPVSAAAKDGE